MDTPLLKVSRPVSACVRCRNAKIRCDSKLPACSACERTGRAAECSNANDHFAKGKERSYVASLESRIEKLEAQLAVRRLGSQTVNGSKGLHSPIVKNANEYPNETFNVDDLVSNFGCL